jgi:histidyl-tRNA synthetase
LKGDNSLQFTTIKGFKDILPGEIETWQTLESAARKLFMSFGFHEIKTPLLEKTELFNRGIGQETDIVSKEMYSFQDTKGRGLTLRPEATASVARAYIQNRLYLKNSVQKLFTIGPMFRHERPQKGRFRQFYQINAELFGDPGPMSDAEIIILTVSLFESIGIRDVTLNLNSLGCPECRPGFRQDLIDYLTERSEQFCPDCRRRSKINPLRVFDCKIKTCQEAVSKAPSILNALCETCTAHFEAVKAYLCESKVPFLLNHRLVRGLDYYSRTAFEIQTDRLGAQSAIAGGGRYDGLVKLLGGPDHPAIGFAVGVERVVALLAEEKTIAAESPDLFIAAIGENAQKTGFNWTISLRQSGLWVEMDYASRGLKSQMKKAGRLGAKRVLLLGDDELASGKALLRDMKLKTQQDLDIDKVEDSLKKICLNKN